MLFSVLVTAFYMHSTLPSTIYKDSPFSTPVPIFLIFLKRGILIVDISV